ncbi:MAG TPA: deoxyguanosinetriphosphate triphosphohydrolase [Ruminiclostridium sp.]|jgi:dGTPase|uniref:Deoxyguanosinetriphosphate triphosphohydrolase-like protein n=1 Tax=Acetivibrio saccincola TaxID=1677857 RepID=A0A2K9EMH1_9FIRM|nr:deoxyguanosinetriphosphate triphosphohydrolase [Acetivibrio saccincola]HAA42425.1 deoxyguanosinetriphosphate triphosphohydrolase [Ruminiclostridium sp.]AUG57791.1 Deoxyguanosinetriphosphate triphosphohydrolase [Acetivibrio saccincola]NLW25838.1 deoxyguanosinetriphosphate triphosphohydrolase [Acetivibrio saccincola]PQQ67676.1 deoxyguanosinetriphosphate triphosphohydrolase [Acetivibrio saccincola]HOA97017.1 deoxyguanosinetriphosphate triphosphohydrolase [Acetivibrio saccincola]
MSIRQEYELIEEKILSPYASLSSKSKGRKFPEPQCEVRTCFQRDKDRIIYSKAFRRLKHKTQVFISPEGDHYRTRLTHTLEVSQIARTIARSLRLNEDLTEAIALGHDLGHTPFGHAGETVLNDICPFGFKHNEQSLRVVDVLERKNGLNLTWEVRDGIKNHTGDTLPQTLEGQIIRFADRIAYINHDIDDAIRGGVISEECLPKECVKVLGETSSQRINNMITNIIRESKNSNIIKMDKEFQEATNEMRKFMFKNVYIGSKAKKEEDKAKNIIKELYNYLKNKPEYLPKEIAKKLETSSIDRVVCDYIAGMTDRYAVKKFHEIFIPESWH